MKISDVMTAEPRSAQAGDSLQAVAHQMEQGDFGSMPVLDDGRLAGVVTDRALLVTNRLRDLQEAAQLMQERQIRRLYVTDNEVLVGVVALADVVDAANDRLSGETIEKISQQ